ncbi:PPE family protein [Mycobacterium intracellulare]|uniref:PPE family protein n=3 Tax=Mycobacterium intracellulare TaxID=1767 RepID=A0A220Y9A2_MYCIT|nr:PPE family protein [Mycobacterium intracellulare]ARV81421.1 PPE family protein [Mycobacterium intracellulare subsp. chimaera]ASL08503.1 PPE family protein [Mycobacterium intracellulare subsp. chimaera]ASL14131.1 PPE family protein [Mycobacterium intracellulare subsp. chimaera]ASL20258.1 PPE family protein [Mycobacterium intracellulare subsp. chimaera]ASQ85437.1 PPE family protein [Mycobacterium intracellulare subsp. chimaera]
MDYGALPPEVNSGRMYVGAGAGPMLAAAAAWDGLATDLYIAAASYTSQISELTCLWTGPASASMAGASAPYVAWLTATAAHAEQTAIQAKAAVGAYEAAFAMTVPPPVIAANRAQLMMLIATNFFGQNLPAIAATEAQYAEMWAQDAAAMYGYAAASAGASELTTFDQPPSTTNPAGQGGQAAAVAHAADTSAQSSVSTPGLANLKSSSALLSASAESSESSKPVAWKDWVSMYTNDLGIVYNHMGDYDHFMKLWEGVIPAAASKGAEAAVAVPGVGGILGGGPLSSGASSAVSAGLGRAGTVGHLSVPQSWAAAAPATGGESNLSALTSTTVGSEAKGGGLLRGIPLTGTGRSAGGKVVGQRYGFRHAVMARSVVGG